MTSYRSSLVNCHHFWSDKMTSHSWKSPAPPSTQGLSTPCASVDSVMWDNALHILPSIENVLGGVRAFLKCRHGCNVRDFIVHWFHSLTSKRAQVALGMDWWPGSSEVTGGKAGTHLDQEPGSPEGRKEWEVSKFLMCRG